MASNQEASLSYYLSHGEIETLTDILLHQRCKARSSAVVQVFGTEPPYYNNWTQRCCGVAIFVADIARRSFFIQVYDPVVGDKIFEQELYKEFHYVAESSFFHQFEGDNEVIGLNFAYQEEAAAFAEAVMALLDKRKLKREERHRPRDDQENVTPTHESSEMNQQQPSVEMRDTNSHTGKKVKGTKKIRKSEIGNPENFVHVCHVGHNSEKLSSSPGKNQEAILATILQLSNIKPKELEDENAKEVFLTFIESNGGLEKVYKKLKSNTSKSFSNFSHASFLKKKKHTVNRPKAPLPELLEESSNSSENRHTADVSSALPNSSSGEFSGWNRIVNDERSTLSVTPIHRKGKLPPTPSQPQTQTRGEMNRSMSLPQDKPEAIPPTPPPPPIAHSPKVAPAPPNRPAMQRSPSLPQGKPTNERQLQKEPTEDTVPRDDLLEQIRNPGIRLKKVEHVANEKTHSSGFENSLIASLAQTLEGRSRACRGSSSGEETETEEDSTEDSDDWD